MRWSRVLVTALSALALLGACGSPESTPDAAASPDQAVRVNLFGEVRATDGNTLPDDATVEIRLRRQDAEDLESSTVAITTIKADTAPPFPFSLIYQAQDLEPDAHYVLEARAITAQGQLTHATRAAVPLPSPGDGVSVNLQISPIAPQSQAPAPVVTAYQCGATNLIVQSERDDITIYGATEAPLRLTRERSASGTQYRDDAGNGFWSHAREARLTLGGQLRECDEDPAGSRRVAARMAGASVYAVGQEPGWFLTVVPDDRVTLVADYGSQVVVTPPASGHAVNGGWVYNAQTKGHALNIVVRDTPCTDAMSGAQWPRTVTVTLDDRQLQGCGARWDTQTEPAGRPS